MRYLNRFIFLSVLSLGSVLLSNLASAQIESYPFNNNVQELRFKSLINELRCPKCQNQTLADSDAEIAKDLKQRVYDLLQADQTDDQIRQHLVDRYGDFISYKPPVKASTWLLWFGPAVLLLIAVILAILSLRAGQGARAEGLSNPEQDESELRDLRSQLNAGSSIRSDEDVK